MSWPARTGCGPTNQECEQTVHESRTNGRTSRDIISFPIQTTYDVRSDSSDVVYQITVLGYLELAAVRIMVLCDNFAVMRQDKVIGLKLNVSIMVREEDCDVALRRSPPSGYHSIRKVTKRPALARSRSRLSGNEHTPRLDETVCPPQYPLPGFGVSGKQIQEYMRDIDGPQLHEASFGPPTSV